MYSSSLKNCVYFSRIFAPHNNDLHQGETERGGEKKNFKMFDAAAKTRTNQTQSTIPHQTSICTPL